jgi:hypothetical protein
MAVDADTIWFGPAADLAGSYWYDDGLQSIPEMAVSMSMSWQRRAVSPGELLVLSTVVTWGTGSIAPTLEFDSSTIPSKVTPWEMIDINGTAFDADGDAISVLLVFDRDYSKPITIGSQLESGSPFHYEMRVLDHSTVEGKHEIEICGLDETGTFSELQRFDILSEIPPATATIPATPTSSSPFTPITISAARHRRRIMQLLMYNLALD